MTVSRGENLIFLISQPRSGSTLLQLMLSGHPDIATTSEPWIALHPVYSLKNSGIDTVYNSNLALSALRDFLKHNGVDEEFYKEQIASFLMNLYNLAIKHQNKKIFLDKTPRYYHIINEIMDIFPEAKFIIILRNPLAILSSILKTWVGDDLLKIGNFRDDLIKAPQILLDCVSLHPDRCYRVKYEDIIMKPEDVLKDVCQFLGITYTSEMVDYGDRINREWNFGDKVGIHKAKRPTTESLKSWENGFTTPQERYLAISYLKELGPALIKDMGYDYYDMESSIEIPGGDSYDNLISWDTIMSDLEGFSRVKEVRDLVYKILSDERIWSDKQDTFEGDKENYEWREIIRIVAERFIDSQTKSLRKERDRMLNTLSWRLTMPLRMIGKYFDTPPQADGVSKYFTKKSKRPKGRGI